MKILVTGMTPTQSGRPGRFQWLIVPALFTEALRLAGHEVEHRATVPDEDLTSYDVILVGLVPPGSIAARHVYVVMDVIARARASGCGLLFYVDDWQYDKILSGCKNKHKQKHGLYNSIQGRTFRDWAETDQGRERVALSMEALATRPWPTTIGVAYPWGDHAQLPDTPARETVFVDPSSLAWDKINAMIERDPVEPYERQRRWILASLSRHHDWVNQQGFSWPVELIGPKHTGATYTLKEHEIVQLVRQSWGALVPPYHHAGSGWWRPRMQYTAVAGAISLVNAEDAARLGSAFQLTRPDVEVLPASQLTDLAWEQRKALVAQTWSKGQLVEALNSIVTKARIGPTKAGPDRNDAIMLKAPLWFKAGLEKPAKIYYGTSDTPFTRLLAEELGDVGTVMTRMDTEQLVAANQHLAADLIAPQEIRRPDTQRDTTREFDQTYLRESKHGERVHRDYAAHFFRWGWATRIIKPEDHVLDVGCGPDLSLVKVLAMGGRYVPERYVGVDLNKLKPSAGWAELLGETNFIEYQKTSVSVFSKVVCFEVIEHMTYEQGIKLLAAMHAALKPGGMLLLSTPVFNGKAAANHVHEWEVPELATAVMDAGFSIDARYGTFASYPDIKRIAIPEHLQILEDLRVFYSDEVTACFLAPLYPDQSRNNVWLLRKQEVGQE
jgi:2-polyprenyl-3-methyl-5-hydroxy-6-metoxy-1,4-benzoquinol methylase